MAICRSTSPVLEFSPPLLSPCSSLPPLLFPIRGRRRMSSEGQKVGREELLLTTLLPEATTSVGLVGGPALHREQGKEQCKQQPK